MKTRGHRCGLETLPNLPSWPPYPKASGTSRSAAPEAEHTARDHVLYLAHELFSISPNLLLGLQPSKCLPKVPSQVVPIPSTQDWRV